MKVNKVFSSIMDSFRSNEQHTNSQSHGENVQDQEDQRVNPDSSPSEPPISNDAHRDNWGSQVEFLLSCLSFAVGLGNIWRFPYLCYRNGGGAFLIPYALNIFFTGIPLFFFELSFGQFASKSPVAIWSILPLFKGIGYSMFIISFGIGLYYNVIIAWTLYYLGATLSSLFDDHLPWITCNNPWNTAGCLVLHNYEKDLNSTTVKDVNTDSAAQEYFTRQMLQISSGLEEPGSFRLELVICLFLAWTVVFIALLKGVKSFGKAVYFTAIFPYIILTILLIRGVTLNGAVDGILFYIKPDWSRLGHVQVWADAAIQIFFSLGPCWGGLITLASYNKFSNNCFRDAVVIAVANCATSFFAGFVVFSFVGFMAYELDKDVGEVVASGPGLAFVVYPEAVSMIPGAKVWAILFFTMLLALGLGTQFSVLETVVSIIVDAWPKKWGKGNHFLVLLCVCVCMFVIGLSMVTNGGMYVIQLLDNHAGTFSALITGLTEIAVVSWFYGADRFLTDIQTMFQWSTNGVLYKVFHKFWMTMWKFVTPLLILLILIATWIGHEPMTYDKYIYPSWANGLGWFISFLSASTIPTILIVKVISETGPISKRFRKLLKPTANWGPRLRQHRLQAVNNWKQKGFDCADLEFSGNPVSNSVQDYSRTSSSSV